MKGFTEDALTISAGSLFQNGTARFVKANWRRRVQHHCRWNLQAWPTGFIGSADNIYSALSLVFKTIPRSLVVVTVGMVLVWGGGGGEGG